MNKRLIFAVLLVLILSITFFSACSDGQDDTNEELTKEETTAVETEDPDPTDTTSSNDPVDPPDDTDGTETGNKTEEQTTVPKDPEAWTDDWTNLY